MEYAVWGTKSGVCEKWRFWSTGPTTSSFLRTLAEPINVGLFEREDLERPSLERMEHVPLEVRTWRWRGILVVLQSLLLRQREYLGRFGHAEAAYSNDSCSILLTVW